MENFIELITNQEILTISNLILAFFICFHIVCEFAHYIHEYVSRKNDNELLSEVNERLKILKLEMDQRKCNKCHVKEEE